MTKPTLTILSFVLFAVSCSTDAELSPDIVTLSDPVSVVVPDTLQESSWAGLLTALRHEPATDHLFAVDPINGRVAEFSIDGSLLRLFGPRGQGPGEIMSATSFEVGPSAVWIVDARGGKLVRYSREDDSYHETQLPFPVESIGLAPNGGLIVTRMQVHPSTDGEPLFAQYSTSLSEERRFGSTELSPSPRCFGCQVHALGDSTLVFVEGVSGVIRTIDLEGRLLRSIDLGDLIPELSSWRTANQTLADEQADRGMRAFYPIAIQTTSYPGQRLGVTVRLPNPVEAGFAHWLIDLGTQPPRVVRTRFDPVGHGVTGAMTEDGMFIVSSATTGGVYAYSSRPTNPKGGEG